MNTEYLNFCPRLKQMVDTGQSTGRNDQPIKVGGLSTLNNLRIIRELLIRHPCHRTLEVGLGFGASALTFLATQKEQRGENFHHTAIDPYQNKRFQGSALRLIEEEGYSGHFTFMEDYSLYALPELAKAGNTYDLVYIDGSHMFEDVFVDFYCTAMILNREGIVLFDDCRDRNVAKVLRFIRRNFSSSLQPLDLSEVDDPDKSLVKRLGNALGIRQLQGFRKTGSMVRKYGTPLKDF